MENSLALNHKLDELIESLKSLLKEIDEEDLAEHEYREQQDLGFGNTNFESQAPPSFDLYTPPMTYSKKVEVTIEIPIEVEPLDHAKLEDLGLNTCSHDLFLSSKKVPSVDEPEPQLLPNFPSLDVNLGDKRGTDSPINPYSPRSFRMKLVEPLTIHTPPPPHVAYFHRNDVYHYYHPHLMLSRKAHLLENMQIPSVGCVETAFVTPSRVPDVVTIFPDAGTYKTRREVSNIVFGHNYSPSYETADSDDSPGHTTGNVEDQPLGEKEKFGNGL
ncbi:hypothetical protein Tco_1450093 [Tanacetum coccineum]